MLSTIQAYLRQSAARDRLTEAIGPFLATFDAGDTHPSINYAIPDDHAAPTTAEVQALIAAYRARGCVPRLEYMPALAPAAEAPLRAAGFAGEGLMPVMILPPDMAAKPPAIHGIDLITPVTEPEIEALVAAQSEAFGGSEVDDEAVERARRFISKGGVALLARDQATGEPAGGGMLDLPLGGVSEIVGIGVREAYRRRGIAGAITARLALSAREAGIATVYLVAAHDEAARTYQRAGLVTIGHMLQLEWIATGF
jgi:GNAT superfamily N-acetyltransferase